MQDHEIIRWVRKGLRADYYEEFSVNLEGKSGKTQGYASDIVFVKVSLAGHDKKRQELSLAVKFAKKALRKIPLMRIWYKREICFYEEIVKLFKEHEIEKNIEEPLDVLPECHATYSEDDMDILFLENLRTKGYCLHPKNSTMNIEHIKLILKNFAKFHALSFSLKEQKKEIFSKLIESGGFRANSDALQIMGDFFENGVEKVLKILKQSDKIALYNKFQDLTKPDMKQMIADILDADVDNKVIVHTDCHNNNFMFKYQRENKTEPTNVAFLDWQITRYHSPVIDLSYFLYSVASKTELSQSKYLFDYYYEELTRFLKKLGNNPDTIFSFSSLKDHWKKYSFYGFAYACSFMDYDYVKTEDAPNLDDVEDINSLGKKLSSVCLEDNELYRDRLIAVVEHYFENVNF